MVTPASGISQCAAIHDRSWFKLTVAGYSYLSRSYMFRGGGESDTDSGMISIRPEMIFCVSVSNHFSKISLFVVSESLLAVSLSGVSDSPFVVSESLFAVSESLSAVSESLFVVSESF